jgi:N-acetylglucosamine kinase-like BadF-type ATPase
MGAGPDSSHHVIGVDAGGSKTAALLARVEHSDTSTRIVELGRGMAGPGNAISIGWEKTCAAICDSIGQAFADAGIPGEKVESLCLAMAGAGTRAMQERFESWGLDAGLASRVQVVTDGNAVLAAGTARGVGIALIAGTGALALARTETGELFRCGGWGYRLGDEGGGYWLGLEGLRMMTEMEDGRRERTELKEVLLKTWGVDEVRQVVEEVARGEADASSDMRERIARLAQVVFQLAEQQQDPAANKLVDAAAAALRQLVLVLLSRTDLAGGEYELALGGSLLTRSDVLAERLLTGLALTGHAPRRVTRVGEPESGAVRIAAGLFGTRRDA